MKCRFCQSKLDKMFIDLGHAPPSNAYLLEADLTKVEKYYPLKVMVCEKCWLVQTLDTQTPSDYFDENYAYLSGASSTWRAHVRTFVEDICRAFPLNKDSFVLEIASNDGHLLTNFVEKKIPCMGIEPTKSTAKQAEILGIPTLNQFFSYGLAKSLNQRGQSADLIIANNVFAHVPDIVDFARGLKEILKPSGNITIEFPHLLNLIKLGQFDTIYHEHFSYLSLFTVKNILSSVGLKIWKVDKLQTHGGSLRIFACHKERKIQVESTVSETLQEEQEFGLQTSEVYTSFNAVAEKIKDELLKFLINEKEKGKRVVAYGAAAKGNTLLNYAGVKPDLINTVYDLAQSKQNKFLPGSHIPVANPEELKTTAPDFVLILAWNIADEIRQNLKHLDAYGTKFIVAIPELRIL